MRKHLSLIAGLLLLATPALADWTGKDASGATITFKNTNTCSSVVCVPVAQPVDSTGAAFGVTGNPFFVSGSVTANAGTNLNTSALALESGGNLASINTKTPALGQALAAASTPVVLPATQITALTPPTSVGVNNFPATQPISAASLPLPSGAATSIKQSDGTQKSQRVDGSGNVAPAGDIAARAGFQKLTDGTNTAAVKAASTASAAADPSVATNESPNSQLSVATGTAADAPATLPASTTPASGISLWKAIANALNSLLSAMTTPLDNTSVPVNISTSTTTQLVALSGTTQVRVTSYDVMAGGTGTFQLVSGTGTACATGQQPLTGAYPLTAQAGIAKGSGIGTILKAPAGNAVCAVTVGAVQYSGSLSFQQF